MKKIYFSEKNFTSILTGALFFLFLPARAENEIIIEKADTLNKQSLRTHQVNDSIQPLPTDTLLTDSVFTSKKIRRMPSPQRATILSAVMPGLGQAYNHKYWKIPIIYALGAGLYYYYDYQNDYYAYYRQKYNEEIRKTFPSEYLTGAYRLAYQDASRYRGYAVLFMGILYVANIVDAMTDAYFLQYDISDDLTVRVTPSVILPTVFESTGTSYGLCLNFNF